MTRTDIVAMAFGILVAGLVALGLMKYADHKSWERYNNQVELERLQRRMQEIEEATESGMPASLDGGAGGSEGSDRDEVTINYDRLFSDSFR